MVLLKEKYKILFLTNHPQDCGKQHKLCVLNERVAKLVDWLPLSPDIPCCICVGDKALEALECVEASGIENKIGDHQPGEIETCQ